MLRKEKEGMMADEQRARLRQMLTRLRKRTKKYRQDLSELDAEIKWNVKIAQSFFNSAKAKYVSPDLKMTQRAEARRFERSAAASKRKKARVQQQMQGHLDLCKQVTGILAALKA
jgi:hypothetical protein